jgi:phenylacetic acid degradation operon negative regulatory protein
MSLDLLTIQAGTQPPLASARATDTVQRVNLGSARGLLLTMLGEFVFTERRPVWTGTLVHVMGAMGVAEKAARQSIARAAASGWIEGTKDGRRTSWQLTPRMVRTMSLGMQRVKSMGHQASQWDGRWLVLSMALPETHRAIRQKLYRLLGWVGFGNASPGLWVNPHAGRIDEARRLVEQFDLHGLAFGFVGTSVDLGVTDRMLVARSWDLDAVAQHYDDLLARFSQLHPRSDESRLMAQIQLVHEWQQLPFVDPGLPPELLPAGWTGRKAARKLEALRARWPCRLDHGP